MKALILNSGMGKRMGSLTSDRPKCLTELIGNETILSRQLRMIYEAGVKDVVITTGFYDSTIREYCNGLDLPLNYQFVKNSKYDITNYIFSIYCARDFLDDDIVLMHGDLIFEQSVLDGVLSSAGSVAVVSSTAPVPLDDFKAVIKNNKILKIGVNFFDDVLPLQPLYKFDRSTWNSLLSEIISFCENGNTNCYAEEAFNNIGDKLDLVPFDICDLICNEIDCPSDLKRSIELLNAFNNRLVYMCFSTDVIHGGHINIIKKARKLGKLMIGVLTDEVVMSYKRYPLLPYEERANTFSNISGVYKVVEQDTLSYRKNIIKYHPDIIVHGDNWVSGVQKPIRDEVIQLLEEYGGKLIEFPYSSDEKYVGIEKRARKELSLPDMRRARLRNIISMKGFATAIEAHNGITGLIAEDTTVEMNGEIHQFDAMWVSSLCDSTSKGKPDIELVDMTSRFRTIDEIMDVTTKPIIFDGDTGGLTEHFVYTVRTLERMGVSMVIIEDKTGLKKNSLFGTDVVQTQDTIENFCNKITAGKKAQKSSDFMICARIESLILEKGMEDALTRAHAFVNAGADAIMIHSRKKDPTEIFEFVEKMRLTDPFTPIVVVPTSFNSVTEREFKDRGVNVVIYANHLTRSGIPAMREAAQIILKNGRSLECDDICMPIKQILTMIPDDE